MHHTSPIILLVVIIYIYIYMRKYGEAQSKAQGDEECPAKRRSCYKQNMFCIGLPVCYFCEDDDKVITIDWVDNGYDRIVVRTVDDTDVLILLIGNISYMDELGDSTIYALHGMVQDLRHTTTSLEWVWNLVTRLVRLFHSGTHLQVVIALQSFSI